MNQAGTMLPWSYLRGYRHGKRPCIQLRHRFSKPLVPGPNPGGCSFNRRNSKEIGDRAVVRDVQEHPSPSEILPPTLKKWTLCGHPET